MDFPCSKKEWKSKADYRPVNSQSTCFHSKLQNGNSEKSQECYTSQRLGIFVGSDRCVFACPDSSTVTQISSVHSEWQGVPFQSPPVRSLNESLRFHAPYDGHCDASKEKGNNNASISRRLVISEPKSSNSVGTQTLHYVSYNIPRSDYQLPEIRPHSYSNFHFHRNGISNLFQHCQSSTSKSSETIGNYHDHLSENIHISQSFPFSFGTTQCSSGFCNARQTTSPTIANVPALSMETTKIFTESPNQDISEHYFHNGLQPSLLSNKHIYYRGIIRSALLSKYCMLKNPRDPTEYTDINVYYFRFTFAVDVSTSRLKSAQVHFSSSEFESLFFNIICLLLD